MRALTCDQGALSWADVDDPDPGPDQVLLRIEATAVNRADLLQRRGHYPPPPGASPILGLEAAGTVERAAGRWREGDQVMAILAGGGYAQRVAVDPGHLLPIPARVGMPAAAGVMEVFLTAFLNLVELGGLRAGERLLIHGGAGGVGTAAVQLARELGAEVWTTSSAAKRERCLALGATRALDYGSEAFEDELRAAGGAQLILDCMGAKYLKRNVEALADDGRLVIIGLQGGVKAELNLLRLLSRRLRLQGSTLRALPADRKAALVSRFEEQVWPLLDAGRLEVVVDSVLPITEAEAAHQRLADSAHVGKILLTVP